ncbi:MAG: hypothetical protein JRJ29_12850 [Deltaproteobacteria bacterium]|nr:hypothetical protein [Deltaproteobacteria bacterium]
MDNRVLYRTGIGVMQTKSGCHWKGIAPEEESALKWEHSGYNMGAHWMARDRFMDLPSLKVDPGPGWEEIAP